MSNHHVPNPVLVSSVGLAFALIGGYFIQSHVVDTTRYLALEKVGVVVPGVLETETNRRGGPSGMGKSKFTISYDVDGQTYTTGRIDEREIKIKTKSVSAYPGKDVPMLVDKANPGNAEVKQSSVKYDVKRLGFGGIFTFVGGLLVFVSIRSVILGKREVVSEEAVDGSED